MSSAAECPMDRLSQWHCRRGACCSAAHLLDFRPAGMIFGVAHDLSGPPMGQRTTASQGMARDV